MAADAQPLRHYRVGYLGSDPLVPTNPGWQGFVRALREQGYTEGQNLVIEYRSAGGQNEAFPALAAELVKLKVDVMVAHASTAVQAAKRATSTIPIFSGPPRPSASQSPPRCWHERTRSSTS